MITENNNSIMLNYILAGRKYARLDVRKEIMYKVINHGEVKDSCKIDFMSNNDVMIVPLTVCWWGMRVKIIEGMAHGKVPLYQLKLGQKE